MGRLLLILPIGIIAQFIDGSLGMGYGASSSSFLLAVGLMPAAVSASVHMAEIFSSLASGVSHLKLGNVDKAIALPLTCGGAAGGVLGAYFLSNIDGRIIKPYIGLLLIAVGVKILFTYLRGRAGFRVKSRISGKYLVPLGLIGGAVDAIGGGGWGPICTPAIISTNKSEPRVAVGSVNAAEFLTTLAITITFALALGIEQFLWHITLPLMVGGMIAAPLSAYVCKKIAPGSLGVAIGIVLILLNLRVVAPVVSGKLGVVLPVKFDMLIVFAAIAVGLFSLAVGVVLQKRLVAGEES